MIKFAEEMTPEQLRIATQRLLGNEFSEGRSDKSDSYLADVSYQLFRKRFPGHMVNHRVDSDALTGLSCYGTIEINNQSEIIWKSPVGDPNSNLAYMRAQLHWLMSEGFDFPDDE